MGNRSSGGSATPKLGAAIPSKRERERQRESFDSKYTQTFYPDVRFVSMGCPHAMPTLPLNPSTSHSLHTVALPLRFRLQCAAEDGHRPPIIRKLGRKGAGGVCCGTEKQSHSQSHIYLSEYMEHMEETTTKPNLAWKDWPGGRRDQVDLLFQCFGYWPESSAPVDVQDVLRATQMSETHAMFAGTTSHPFRAMYTRTHRSWVVQGG